MGSQAMKYIYMLGKTSIQLYNRDHWNTRLDPSGKCEAGPILALSGACRWRTSAISHKKSALDACKAGCSPIETPYGVKAFRFVNCKLVNMPKPQHLPSFLGLGRNDLLQCVHNECHVVRSFDSLQKLCNPWTKHTESIPDFFGSSFLFNIFTFRFAFGV